MAPWRPRSKTEALSSPGGRFKGSKTTSSCDTGRSVKGDQDSAQNGFVVETISCLHQQQRFRNRSLRMSSSSPLPSPQLRNTNNSGGGGYIINSMQERPLGQDDNVTMNTSTQPRSGSVTGYKTTAATKGSGRPRRSQQHTRPRCSLVHVCTWVVIVLGLILNQTLASSAEYSPSERTQNDPPPEQQPPQHWMALEQNPRMDKECVMQRQPTTVGAQFETGYDLDYVISSSSSSSSTTGSTGSRARRRKRELSSTTSVSSAESHGIFPRREWSVPQASKAVNVPLSSMRSMAVVNSSTMLCNGRSDICDLRYNQVTYPGTHNSATYQLEYDCTTATNICLQTTTVCAQQAQNCTQGWETRCTNISNTCLQRLPNWLHWLCGAFSSACEATEQFCLGWEEICTSSLEICTLWGSACDLVIPAWAIPCLWENQQAHTVAQQLNDGIRFLDLGTCLTNNNTQIVMCHGNGGTRAIGVPLDTVMSDILTFMIANPYEVVTVEFNEYDGDVSLVSQAIVAKVLQYFILPTGQSLMWPRTSLSQPWPTLREMILANQRLLLFMGDTYYPIPDPKPEWANQKDTWKQDGFSYTSQDTEPVQLNASYYSWCNQGPPTDGSFIQWQQIDINLGIIESDIIATVQKGEVPQLCIEPLAVQTNSAMLDALATYCYTRWPYWFRIRVNDYWEGDVFKMTNIFNDKNVARVKAGDSITPY